MASTLNNLEPVLLWNNFDSICKIPRTSKNEEKVIEFVVNFAINHNLKYKKDQVGNVVISKPATSGNENKPIIVLQAHLDMVPQKNASSSHDFSKDPIITCIDGDWVHAKDTTLGADNGIGVSAGLAVLEATGIKHGPVEVLFTIDEETGMSGAMNLAVDFVKGRILMNLDSEDEGELYIGCAGGINTTAKFTFEPQPLPPGIKAFKIKITGLKGGHSGVDINLGRGNANKLMNRLLWKASRELGLRIASIEGGSVRNAIPRESFATAVLPAGKEIAFKSMVDEFRSEVINELSSVDPGIKIDVTETDLPKHIVNKDVQDRFLNAVYAFPDGVIRMSADIAGIVETSTNLSIIKSYNNYIEISCLSRSSLDSAKSDLCNAITSVFELAGAGIVHEGSYPGWKPNVNSPVLATMKKIYKDKFGTSPEIKVIHAGLECGIIGDVYKGMDMISFGPTIKNAHSPDEKVNIPSVQKFWSYLTEVLEKIKS
jgi:dipeptidase D